MATKSEETAARAATDDLGASPRLRNPQAIDAEAKDVVILAGRFYTACLASLSRHETPVLSIVKRSPLEILLVLTGAIGGIAAIWDKLLDIEVKLRTRDVRVAAQRARLEKEIAESKQATIACEGLRNAFASTSTEFYGPVDQVVIYDNIDDAQAELLQ